MKSRATDVLLWVGSAGYRTASVINSNYTYFEDLTLQTLHGLHSVRDVVILKELATCQLNALHSNYFVALLCQPTKEPFQVLSKKERHVQIMAEQGPLESKTPRKK